MELYLCGFGKGGIRFVMGLGREGEVAEGLVEESRGFWSQQHADQAV